MYTGCRSQSAICCCHHCGHVMDVLQGQADSCVHCQDLKIERTRMMFIKHYAPNRCLCIKVANSIDHWVEDCRDVTKAGGGGICTKNGSYCEKEKKGRGGGVGGGGGGGGQGRCERRSEAFVNIQKKKIFFFFLGGGGGSG